MTREEEILKAARNYVNDVSLSSPSNVIHFEYGAKWADEHSNLESLWHDASEEPIMGARVLINHHLIVITWHNEYKWDACCKLFGITKWAYVSDLLPKQFGNSEQLKGGER